MIISKVANIVHVAIGHDGIHAILVNDDGTVYFAGTARRGEDGDTSKNRRQPKAVKPKKLAKIDSHFIVHASCNNGTYGMYIFQGVQKLKGIFCVCLCHRHIGLCHKSWQINYVWQGYGPL